MCTENFLPTRRNTFLKIPNVKRCFRSLTKASSFTKFLLARFCSTQRMASAVKSLCTFILNPNLLNTVRRLSASHKKVITRKALALRLTTVLRPTFILHRPCSLLEVCTREVFIIEDHTQTTRIMGQGIILCLKYNKRKTVIMIL